MKRSSGMKSTQRKIYPISNYGTTKDIPYRIAKERYVRRYEERMKISAWWSWVGLSPKNEGDFTANSIFEHYSLRTEAPVKHIPGMNNADASGNNRMAVTGIDLICINTKYQRLQYSFKIWNAVIATSPPP